MKISQSVEKGKCNHSLCRHILFVVLVVVLFQRLALDQDQLLVQHKGHLGVETLPHLFGSCLVWCDVTVRAYHVHSCWQSNVVYINAWAKDHYSFPWQSSHNIIWSASLALLIKQWSMLIMPSNVTRWALLPMLVINCLLPVKNSDDTCSISSAIYILNKSYMLRLVAIHPE